jgi:hypothetical protein
MVLPAQAGSSSEATKLNTGTKRLAAWLQLLHQPFMAINISTPKADNYQEPSPLFPLSLFDAALFSLAIILTPKFLPPAAGRCLVCLHRSASHTVFKQKEQRELHENKNACFSCIRSRVTIHLATWQTFRGSVVDGAAFVRSATRVAKLLHIIIV